MSIHLDPEDVGRLGPKARQQIEAAVRAADDTPAMSQTPPQDMSPSPQPTSEQRIAPTGRDGEQSPPEPRPGDTGRLSRRARRWSRAGRGAVPLPAPYRVALAGGVLLLFAVGVWAGGRTVTQGRSTAAASRTGPAGASIVGGAAGAKAGGASDTSLTAQAQADARAAQSAVASALQAAHQAQALLANAQSAFSRVQSLSAPALARQPGAENPAGALGPVTTGAANVEAAVSSARQAAGAASGAAGDSAGIAARDGDAQQAAASASTASQQAQAALEAAQAASGQIASLAQQAQAAVDAWRQVHNAPPGYFGLEYADPPSDWTVRGCEVISAYPGGPAAEAGLIGRKQRTDPVGDVISSITDATDANATWPITSCAGLQAALTQTRAGDQVTVSYYHRQVTFLVGRWVPASGSTTLTGGQSSACPPALTGTITPELAGNRIQLQIELAGHSGETAYGAVLDTGAGVSTFPDQYLRSAGFTPFFTSAASGVVPGARTTAYLYHIPGDAILVNDNGRFVPLATGTLTVNGIPGEGGIWLGPDILKHGAKLSTVGDRWTLEPPCG